MRNDYFKKLNDISTEICYFKSGSYSNNFEIEISKDNDLKLRNYIPIPTNRKKKSKLSKMIKSNVLINKRKSRENRNVDINLKTNREILKEHLISKSLISSNLFD